ncbi:MAG: beta-galactosidase [Demequina sp.]|uniref:beta-galactosidase n=1 Tax=Demequina sp. TaxID=2050685 RepID=UPI003A8A1F63
MSTPISSRPELRLTTPAYGGDWSPEQWDPATWDADIALMREAGVTMITLGVFSWAHLEPKEGLYDLEWIADVIDRLHHAGIAVDLATASASPPAWMATDHPDTLPMDATGVRLGFGSRQQYCPSSPVYRERSRALAAVLADRFGHHPAVAMWHIGNEYACHIHECFCPVCVEAFRTYVADSYGSIDALNDAWGTAFWAQRYTSFDQIGAPAAAPTFLNPAQVLDWRRFSNRQILDCMLGEIDEVRARSELPVTTNFMGAFPWLDYAQWAEHLDVITDDHYPEPSHPTAAAEVAFAGDLMRGLATGKPWMLMEQSPGPVQWRERNAPKRPGQFALWSLSRLAHGADGVLQFQWRQSVKGAETFHAGMVPHAGARSRVWTEVVELGEVLGNLGDVIGEPTAAQVAIVVDWESEWARTAAIGPTNDVMPFAAAQAWHRTLWELGVAVDVVAPERVSGYRLIVVPELFMDRPDLAATVSAAVDEGAVVLVTGPTGIVNASGEAGMDGYLGSWRDLVGVRVVEFSVAVGDGDPRSPRDDAASRITSAVGVPKASTFAGVAVAADGPLDSSITWRGGMWAEELEVDDATVVATFDGSGAGADLAGEPAVTRRQHGAGAAWYAATDLDLASRHLLAETLTSEAGVSPVWPGLPVGVEAQRRGDFLFLLNHSDAPVTVTGVAGHDLVGGTDVASDVHLEARTGKVVRLHL